MLANNQCSKKIIISFCLSILVLPNIAWSEISIKKSIAAKIASCPELPKVTWWKTTRIKIVKYVDFKYRGNWGPYILKWETYKRKMEGILANDGTALVKSRNVSLHGEKLAFHIKEIEQRLKVTKCLQRIFSGQLALRNIPNSTQIGKPKKISNYYLFLESMSLWCVKTHPVMLFWFHSIIFWVFVKSKI